MASENYVGKIERAAETRFCSVEAEENVVRRMLKKPDEAEEAAGALTGGDFSDALLGMLFESIKQVLEDGGQVEFISVDAAFSARFPDSAGALRKRMMELVRFREYTLEDGQSIANVVRIVKQLALRREAIRRMDELGKGLRDPTRALEEVLAEIQDAAEDADGEDDAEWVSLSDVNLNTYEYLEKRQKGEIKAATTGIKSLDELTGGLFGGELTIVAARPSVGKSAFGLNIAMKAAREGFKVGFVSCEMDDKGFGQRTLSRGAWVAGDRMRKAQLTPDDWDHLGNAMVEMDGLPVWFMFNRNTKGGITIENVFRAVKKRARHGEIGLLIVDYIGIMRTAKAFKEERLRIGYISGELKRLAMAANIPVVALCQVNRQAHGRMPTMAELRESGAIEQDADGIIFLHRPENHEDKSIHPDDVRGFYEMQQGGSAYIAVSVAKQRNGQTGITQVMFDPGVMRYSEIMRES